VVAQALKVRWLLGSAVLPRDMPLLAVEADSLLYRLLRPPPLGPGTTRTGSGISGGTGTPAGALSVAAAGQRQSLNNFTHIIQHLAFVGTDKKM